jgi:malonyl CoA-acyl carrier protein transacylase
MQTEAHKQTPLGMTALLLAAPPEKSVEAVGLRAQMIADICKDVSANKQIGSVGVAAVNSPQQIVLSGSTAAIDAVIVALKGSQSSDRNIVKKAIKVAVDIPFHSAYLSPAQSVMRDNLQQQANLVHFDEPHFVYISNLAGQSQADIDAIRSDLVEAITQPVQWFSSVTSAFRLCQQDKALNFIEFGTGSVLAGLVKQTSEYLGKPFTCQSIAAVDEKHQLVAIEKLLIAAAIVNLSAQENTHETA